MFEFRSIWVRGTLTHLDSPLLTIPSSPQLGHLASQRSQHRPSLPKTPLLFYSKTTCVLKTHRVFFRISVNPLHFLFRNISGPEPPANSNFKGALPLLAYRLGGQKNITVEVNNVLVNSKIHNIFGVIKGFTDPGTVRLEDVILS